MTCAGPSTNFRHKPDWFPLEVHNQDLSAAEWVICAARRARAKELLANEQSKDVAIRIFQQEVIDCDYKDDGKWIQEALKPRRPVDNLSVFEATYLAKIHESRIEPDHLDLATRLALNPEAHLGERMLQALSGGSHDRPALLGLSLEELWQHGPNFGGFVPLMVDASLDDDLLRAAFEDWLSERWLPGECDPDKQEPSARKLRPVNAVLENWNRKGVLIAHDLTLWGQITGHRYSDKTIGNLIWPNLHVKKIGQKYREEIKWRVDRLTASDLMARAMSQIRYERYSSLSGQLPLLDSNSE